MNAWIERGGPVMAPLLLLSLVGLAIVFERALFWLRERRRSPAARLDEIRRAATAAWPDLDLERRRLERGMGTLDTIITAAPLLGILGTVLGIIDALELLSARANPDPLAVSGGVAQALITTATGLIISLAVLFPYNVFRVRVRERLADLEREIDAAEASR